MEWNDIQEGKFLMNLLKKACRWLYFFIFIDCRLKILPIELIPRSTLRGIQLQKAAAHFAIQNLLDFNTISLFGIVSVIILLHWSVERGQIFVFLKFDEILQLFEDKQFVDYPTDLNVIYSVVMLLSYSIDVDDSNEVDRVSRSYLPSHSSSC